MAVRGGWKPLTHLTFLSGQGKIDFYQGKVGKFLKLMSAAYLNPLITNVNTQSC